MGCLSIGFGVSSKKPCRGHVSPVIWIKPGRDTPKDVKNPNPKGQDRDPGRDSSGKNKGWQVKGRIPVTSIWAGGGFLFCAIVVVLLRLDLDWSLHWPVFLMLVGVWLAVMPGIRETSGVVFFLGLGALLWLSNLVIAENPDFLLKLPGAIREAMETVLNEFSLTDSLP